MFATAEPHRDCRGLCFLSEPPPPGQPLEQDCIRLSAHASASRDWASRDWASRDWGSSLHYYSSRNFSSRDSLDLEFPRLLGWARLQRLDRLARFVQFRGAQRLSRGPPAFPGKKPCLWTIPRGKAILNPPNSPKEALVLHRELVLSAAPLMQVLDLNALAPIELKSIAAGCQQAV